MFTRLEVSDVACPAQTAVAAPVQVPLTWQGGIVQGISIVIPDGHSGLTGIALGFGGNAVLPYKQPAFISGNDEVIPLAYRDNNPGVEWAVFLCNLDLQAHTWQVRFQLNEIVATVPPVKSVIIPTADILAAGATLLGGP